MKNIPVSFNRLALIGWFPICLFIVGIGFWIGNAYNHQLSWHDATVVIYTACFAIACRVLTGSTNTTVSQHVAVLFGLVTLLFMRLITYMSRS